MNTNEIFDAMSYLDENLIAEHTAIRFSRITAKANLKRKNILRFSCIAASICLFFGITISIAYMDKYYDPGSDPSLSTDSTDGVYSTTEVTSSITPDRGDSGTHFLTNDKEIIIDGEKRTKEEIRNTLTKYDDFLKAVIADYIKDGYINNEDLFVVDAIVGEVFIKGNENTLSENYAFLPIVNTNGNIVARIKMLKTKENVLIDVTCESRERILNQLLIEYSNQDIVIVGVSDGWGSELAITPDGKIHLLGGVIPEYDPKVFYYDYYNAGVNVFTSDMLKNDRLMCVYVKNQQEVNE